MEPQTVLQTSTSERVVPEGLLLNRLQVDRTFTLEELLGEIPELSWAQLFLALDVLSRRGAIELRRDGFSYTVKRMTVSIERGGRTDGAAHHDHR